jgi:hypothetical protein
MAELTLSPATLQARADAACQAARDLRFQASARRVDGRRARVEAERRRSKAVAARDWFEGMRSLRYRSAWSDLPWQMPDGELDRVLVSHGSSSTFTKPSSFFWNLA